ncbi:ubiquitin-protein ligase-like protein molybdopterin-converting factor [Calycina marina]|uniref:Ubiquitin-protein ligase-like protein molybdopterin-converting factor n=1 Tax=Calycina marina TaxID=1763456 RepID=A0A9P7YXU5_9HELO|nr:ubiquitin-protein ligase-like protein molybdopterin-converting factor [Calycina marina]
MDWQYSPPKCLRQKTHYNESPGQLKQSPESEEPPPMMSWFQRTTSTPSFQFGATALVAGGLTAAALLSYQHLRREEAIDELKSSIPELDKSHPGIQLTNYGTASSRHNNGRSTVLSKEDQKSAEFAARARRGDYDDDLIMEQLARNRVFLKDDGLAKLRDAFIIVVGCGGVGSHCTSALARSGVSRIRLIDFDQVTLSSLNRHAVATLADVGTSKVHCLQRRIQQITPWVHFDVRNQLFGPKDAASLLGHWDGKKPDYIVDAIDNIESKVALLEYCYKNGLPVISSMGAGCKSDPTRIFVGDISTSTEDPLSRSTRRRLRAVGVASGIPVVYSTEKPGPGKAELLPLPEEEFAKGSVGDLGVLPDFRVRILPVLGTMPATFGYTCANHVILKVTGYPCEYVPAKGREKLYDGILAQLQGSEEKIIRTMTPGEDAQGLKLPLTALDVGYVVEEVYKGKSAISGVTTRLALVRWRKPTASPIDLRIEKQKSSKIRLRELVCMTKEEASRHEKGITYSDKTPEDLYDAETVQYIEARIQEEIEFEQYR